MDENLVTRETIDPEMPQVEEAGSPILNAWQRFWQGLQQRGWGDLALRLGSALVCLLLVALVIWVMRGFYLKGEMVIPEVAPDLAQSEVSDSAMLLPAYAGVSAYDGISRSNDSHTYVPFQSRFDIQEYTVQQGDYLFDIAQKFGIEPETILFGNFEVLRDNPEMLYPDQVLRILPVDGVLYTWSEGDGLNGVAQGLGVTPEDIINWPGNNLSPETIGDYANPNIAVGTQIIVPGGKREFYSWTIPYIRRDAPASANVWGVGRCDPISTGPVGTGNFVWPTSEHRLSGYPYSPKTNHPAIDIGGKLGNPIYAVDRGVVVYAGWNDNGYGNLIVIDHGNGWQSLYAHLEDTLAVGCGDYITDEGQLIGTMGTTGRSSGPHLHFELITESGARVNPLNYLPM